MITRHLLKREIDKVRDEHLTALYIIIKAFELPAGESIFDADAARPETGLNWERFIQETYGCLQDDPIERGSQGDDIYKDMLELKERKAAGQLKFLSHKEVWSE